MPDGEILCSNQPFIHIHTKFSEDEYDSSGHLSRQSVEFRQTELQIKSYSGSSYELGNNVIRIPYSKICCFQEKQEYEHLGVTKPKIFSTSKEKAQKQNIWTFLLEDGTGLVLKNRETLEKDEGFDFEKDMEMPYMCTANRTSVKNIIGDSKRESTGFVLVESYHGSRGELRVEGWKGGDSDIDADISASSKTKESSTGVEQGPFSVGRSRSKSSIKGNISGKITDNTYSEAIDAFFVLEDRLLIDSQLRLELYYEEVDRVTKTREGLVIQVGETTYRTKVTETEYLEEALSHIQKKISDYSESKSGSTVSSSDKIKELNELYKEGLISEEEFNSTKSDILDDF